MYKSLGFIIILIFLCINVQGHAQKTSEIVTKKTYTTKAITVPPVIDGVLNDESWKAVEWAIDFIENEPDENTAPSEQTQFKIVYDEKNIYVGVRAFDTAPDSIVRRMSRRDGFVGDRVSFVLDSYHDLRTAFIFTVSAAGVKGDEVATDNGNEMDESWNPVWYTKTAIDDKGWTAEMKIPFSQLRFGKTKDQIWGLNFARTFFRNEEMSVWNRIPIDAAGFVSESGLLLGLKDLIPQKQIEIQPYIVGQAESFEKEIGNPFKTGRDSKIIAGLDGKIGITNDMTLDFTINPDFGQVEADPSEISLDGFQIFFDEQRPFFVENKNIFDYKITNSQAGGPFGRDNLFYSRRIGRQPQISPDTESNEYVNAPENTTILGAAKFSGKTKKGLSIGVLEALTQKEFVEIDNNGERRDEVVEPLTNYFLTRIQKDFNRNNTFIGGIITATNRNLKGTGLNILNKAALTGGLDFKHQWKNRKYYVAGNIITSKISGSKEAILDAQLGHRRYFQRVDADHVEVDSTRTSLSGHGGNLQFGRAGGKNFNFEGGITWRSPELELNDMGFQRNADDATHYTWIGYKALKPFSIFRSLRVNYNHWTAINFGGDHTYLGFNTNTNAEFKNFWRTSFGFNYSPVDYSDSDLRGGPQLRLPDSFNSWVTVGTDQRKKLQFSFRTMHNTGQHNSFEFHDYGMRIKYVPFDAFNISVDASYSMNDQELQYVDNIDFNGTTRYLNASMEQDTYAMSIRFNYTIRPNLTIQYYGQPFISRGRYMNFKYITDSKAAEFIDRFQNISASQISYNADNEIYNVDENTDSTTDYSFENPDFSVIEFRSNLVARWEYIPGSEIYLVWSQGISKNGNPNDKLLPSLNDNIFGQTAHNIFLIKATYRFIL
jgi:hypothetical protein